MYIIIRIKQQDSDRGKYWLIDHSHGFPSVLHKRYDEAKTEASRLAMQNPDCHFAIFEYDTAAICKMQPPIWIEKEDL